MPRTHASAAALLVRHIGLTTNLTERMTRTGDEL
jgi:hypothetical protein